jgi:hypothetical protein
MKDFDLVSLEVFDGADKRRRFNRFLTKDLEFREYSRDSPPGNSFPSSRTHIKTISQTLLEKK